MSEPDWSNGWRRSIAPDVVGAGADVRGEEASTFLCQAKATTADMYESVDLAMKKVAKQLAKNKDKVTHHKGGIQKGALPKGSLPKVG